MFLIIPYPSVADRVITVTFIGLFSSILVWYSRSVKVGISSFSSIMSTIKVVSVLKTVLPKDHKTEKL